MSELIKVPLTQAPLPEQIKAILRFVIHTVVGALLFSIVGVVAILLSYLTSFIEGSHVSPYILYGFQGLEIFLFAADIVCLVIFVVKETLIFCRQIWHPPEEA
jgi:hypothetical protein